ncbi:MAG: cysteine desulfurase [Patescibacteria group bacterium]|nr:cysteine desulfurase [Patescibacteria group bacterium]MDE1988102.1 cysteine desulfurase [Patescibacteria group bacterium]MDE2218207.1 cysteine desulfurase [Patescibacteria group bacterium]
MTKIYMDNASTTPISEEVKKAMDKYMTDEFGNPNSIHMMGVAAKNAVEGARKTVASAFNSHPDEVIFNSGGTEGNNAAIFGAFNHLRKNGVKYSEMRAITTNIEHSSVLECFKELERRGVAIDYAPVKENGIVDPVMIKKLLRLETVLVSVMYANNEIGTIQPIKEIAKVVRNFKKAVSYKLLASSYQMSANNYPLFHTDACQAPLFLNLNIQELGVDLMTIDGQKICGPKGIGALFAKRGVLIDPIIFGGGQERGLRSGTENIPLIVGLSKAIEIAGKNRIKNSERLSKLLDYFIKKIEEKIPQVALNGDRIQRLPNNINIFIPGIDSEFIVLQLDEKGIICSTKSACLKNESASYVIAALGRDEKYAQSSLRFSLGLDTTKKNIDYVIKILIELVKDL